MIWCWMYDLLQSSFTTEVSFGIVFTHTMLLLHKCFSDAKKALEAKLVEFNQNGVFFKLEWQK